MPVDEGEEEAIGGALQDVVPRLTPHRRAAWKRTQSKVDFFNKRNIVRNSLQGVE